MDKPVFALPAPPALAHQQNKQRLRGQITRDAVARLKLQERLTLRQIADRLEMSVDGVKDAWKRARREYGKGTLPDEERDHMRAMVRAHIEATMETAGRRLDENAAYGAVVLRSAEMLINLYDLKGSDGQPTAQNHIRERLKVLMEKGRSLSPLLAVPSSPCGSGAQS